MSLFTGKRRPEKSLDDVGCERRPDHAGSQTYHIHRIILDTLARRKGVMAQSAPDAYELVCRDRRAHATSAEYHPPLGPLFDNRTGYELGIVRIIVFRKNRVSAAVQRLVTLGANYSQADLFEREPCVVGSNGDDHVDLDRECVTPDTFAGSPNW